MFGATRTTASCSTPRLSLCKSSFSYKTRGFGTNKGALLTMIWNISSFLFVSYSFQVAAINMQLLFLLTVLVFPVSGWLADVYLGRYNVICWSMKVMWTSVMVCSIFFVVVENTALVHFFPKMENAGVIFGEILYAVGLIGFAGFQANSLQFGLDQFIDASTSDISSYISWYIWSFHLSTCLVLLSQICFCGVYSKLWSFLLFPFFFSLSLLMEVFLSKWLTKEPVTHNPLKMIFQVLKYAVKNKYPRLRSAFTYWDNKRYSRIDLAKTKFGGPFTAEQVEDVKTFFRILVIIGVSSLFLGSIFGLNSTFNRIMFGYSSDPFALKCNTASAWEYLISCYELQIIRYSNSFIMIIFVPVLEFVLYPLLWKFPPFSKVGIMHKFILGMLLELLCEAYIFGVAVVATNMSGGHNSTCLLVTTEKKHLVLSVYFKWLIPSRLFGSISRYLLISSAVEFVYAQSPYSMKGLLGGVVYATTGLTVFLSYGWSLLIKKIVVNSSIEHRCGSWYYFSVIVFNMVLVCFGCMIKKWYSLRKRDEQVPNEQIFATSQYNTEEMPASSS